MKLLKCRLIDEESHVVPFPLQTQSRSDYCIGICIQKETTVTLEYQTSLQQTASGIVVARDTCLHLNEGMFSTNFEVPTTVSKWLIQLKCRWWNQDDVIQLLSLQQDENEMTLQYTNQKLDLLLNQKVLLSIHNDTVQEGEWSFITIKQTEQDLHIKWNEQSEVVMNQSLFPFHSIVSLQVGDCDASWDLLSLSISTLFQTLYSFEFLPLSHLTVHSAIQSPLFASYSYHMENCSWGLSDTLPFTYHSLEQQLESFSLQSSLSSWNEVFSIIYQILMKLRSITIAHKLLSNATLFPMPVSISLECHI